MAVSSDFIKTSIEFLKGVGPSKAELLGKELGIFTFYDLLTHYPFRYVDKSKISKLSDITYDTEYIQLKGTLHSLKEQGFKGKGKRLTGKFQDESGTIELVWFQGAKWMKNVLTSGAEYLLYGKVNRYRGKLTIAHPEMEKWDASKTLKASFEPVYRSTEKLSKKGLDSKGIFKLVQNLFAQLQPVHIPEYLPLQILQKNGLAHRFQAFQFIHFAQDFQQIEQGQERIKFEEFFLPQLNMLKAKLQRQENTSGLVFSRIDDAFDRFFHDVLEFELTGAQKRVLREIRQDVVQGKQMNRLLQGDVGSGKTIVAVMTALMAIDNGFQAAIMAPTEILAQQHYNGIKPMLQKVGVRAELLTGSIKGQRRKDILKALRTGHLHVLIGTHALIEDPVEFENLGIAVIDEQHRFGVAQRAKLWNKASTDIPPHVLVMTATPIPRTLAMTVYGDLDVSVIDELPPGRKPVKTLHRTDAHRLRVHGFLKEEIAKGRQAYIVYPLIEESEHFELKDLMSGFEDVQRVFPYPEYRTSVVHGRMKPAEKDAEMQRFVKGETQVMVATTVIEVGVNVPNASVMVIENAERFGLAQLHQLRGRVGRGADQSYCVLMTKDELNTYAKKRIQTMVNSTDGFVIAEADLELRGPGDIEGTRQSGDLHFKMANLASDQAVLKKARYAAIQLLEQDPELELNENWPLRNFLQKSTALAGYWSRIS
ncbi:MAG: ATP-dependent DNA helicase RecG [Saprospiraceae bacterium]|nr:ATP-dependent DNA helicase RecG [Saprospiraceae bacterium]